MLGKLMVILMVMVMVILGWVATYWGASSVTQATIRYSIIIQTGCLFWQRLNIHFAELQKIRKTSFHCHSCLILKKVHTHTNPNWALESVSCFTNFHQSVGLQCKHLTASCIMQKSKASGVYFCMMRTVEINPLLTYHTFLFMMVAEYWTVYNCSSLVLPKP